MEFSFVIFEISVDKLSLSGLKEIEKLVIIIYVDFSLTRKKISKSKTISVNHHVVSDTLQYGIFIRVAGEA